MAMVTQFYHTRDPIENLRVRVVARKVAHGNGSKAKRAVALGTTWSYSFRWQEKKSSQTEIHARNAKHAKSKLSQPEADVTATQSTGDKAESHGIALVSYVDADNYVPRSTVDRRAATTSLAPPLHLAAAAVDYHLSKTKSKSSSTSGAALSNSDRVALRVHREETFRQMHVVLRVTSDAPDSTRPTTEDVVLATLRYYPHTGLLCATPGFSTCLDPTTEKDDRLENKGPQLSTLHATCRSTGDQFEYALDNENDLCPLESADDHCLVRELQRQDGLHDIAQVEQWRNKHGDSTKTMPQTTTAASRSVDGNTVEPDEQMLVLLEVVSVRGVHGACDPIRVAVELTLPSENAKECRTPREWKVANGALRSSTSLSRATADGDLAVFGHHVQFHLKRTSCVAKRAEDMETEILGSHWPVLKLAVFSTDSWSRERLVGHAELRLPRAAGFSDTQVALVRPLLTPQERLEEFFLGTDSHAATSVLGEASETKRKSEASVLSRLGARTVSTDGRVRVRIQLIQSLPHRVQIVEKAPFPSAAILRDGAATPSVITKRSVEEILQSVKTTKRYALGAMDRSVSLSIASGSNSTPLSAVSAILARLKDQTSARGTSSSAG